MLEHCALLPLFLAVDTNAGSSKPPSQYYFSEDRERQDI